MNNKMFDLSGAFSSFSSNDIEAAKEFYGNILGLNYKEVMGGLSIKLEGCDIFIYPKPDHTPATFTVLNFNVDDIEAVVDELTRRGVTFERYEMQGMRTNEKGIVEGEHGPRIAWFKDPAGNILSVVE